MASPIAPEPFTVNFEDGRAPERISIKPLSISKLYQWLYLAVDRGEVEMVMLCTGKEKDWVDSLDLDSFGLLAEKCNAINFPRAVRLAKRGAPIAAALIAPLTQRNLMGLRITTALLTPSGDSSSTPPPSGSVPATTNA